MICHRKKLWTNGWSEEVVMRHWGEAERPVRAGSGPPLAWFLLGLIRIRGGAARHFASAWLFHRGIHLEATLASSGIKMVILQRFGSVNLALKVDS